VPGRPIANGSISFGLVSIPVKLFSATRSKSISFKLIHGKDNSRIQQKIFCPVDNAIIDRNELVRGFEVEKDVIVTFTADELEKLEAHDDHLIDIQEFIPLTEVDPIYFENSYHLGCAPEAARAYRLLAHALETTARVALARFTMRSKEYLVLIRPYEKGLMLHTMYYADEVVAAKEIERGEAAEVGQQELALAKRLIGDLADQKFEPSKYKDHYRDRVIAAAQEKVKGKEAIEAPSPAASKGKVIDLYSALKASLEKRGVKFGEAAAEERAEIEAHEAITGKAKASRRPPRAAVSGRKRR
jgi:DNA end-binding protein Ku